MSEYDRTFAQSDKTPQDVDSAQGDTNSTGNNRPPKVDSSQRKTKNGIRGWLLLLCLSLIGIRAIMIVTMSPGLFLPTGARAFSFSLIVDALFGILAGILLWTRSKNSVTLAKLYFIVHPYLTVLNWSVLLPHSSPDAAQAPVAIVWSVIGSVLWFSYLTFSRRVKNTYALQPESRSPLVAFAMGAALGPIGTIYFHIRVLLPTLIGSIAAVTIAVLCSRLFGAIIPPWMGWVWVAFYGVANLILAIQWNETEAAGEEAQSWTSATVFGAAVGIWGFRILGITTAIYGGIDLVANHHIVQGVIFFLVLPWLMGLPARWLMHIITLLVAAISGVRRENSK